MYEKHIISSTRVSSLCYHKRSPKWKLDSHVFQVWTRNNTCSEQYVSNRWSRQISARVNVTIHWSSVTKWSAPTERIIASLAKISEEITSRAYIVNSKLSLHSRGKLLLHLNGRNCLFSLERRNISPKTHWNEEREKHTGITWTNRNNLGGKLKKQPGFNHKERLMKHPGSQFRRLENKTRQCCA